MMFGTREPFEYFECLSCGCLQIMQVPDDLSPFYPEGYYSHRIPRRAGNPSRFKRYRTRKWMEHLLGRRSLVGAWQARRHTEPFYAAWLREGRLERDSAVLDVGCGAGRLLFSMRDAGFTNLTGADPFLAAEFRPDESLRLLKRGLPEMEGSFDLVMMHHAFEHVPDPTEAMKLLAGLTRKGGLLFLRVPLCSSFAWRTYRADWVQLDAPRHLHLHTRRSLEILAARAGLEIERVHFDSTAFQFWGSEQ